MRLPSSKRHKTKIPGRNASVHGLTERTQTTRWNTPLNEQTPRKKLKHKIIDDTIGPLLHFDSGTVGITYKITNAQNYIWICNAEGCISETHGKTYPADKNQYSATLRKRRETHIGETNFLYFPIACSRIGNVKTYKAEKMPIPTQ